MGDEEKQQDQQPSQSTPPEVRVVNAWAAASVLVLSAVAEICGMALASGLLFYGRIGAYEWGAAMAYCLGGNFVGKARGKMPTPLTAVALGLGVASKVGIGTALKHTLLGVVALLTVGCGASVYSSTLDVINTTAATVTQAQPAVLALCQVDPGPRCDDARKAYEVAGSAVAAAHDALEAYRVTGEGLDAVADAVRVAAKSAREVARVSAQ